MILPALLDPYASDWLEAALRFLHVVAAIAWIGASFYFIALDNHLRPPERREDSDRGVGGEAWEIHGGGFYRIEKFTVAPRRLPEPLHWFKWEAYTTWLSGFGLLVVLYYLDAEAYLVDRSVLDLSTGAAVGASIGLLVAAWLVYDVLCRTVADEALLGGLVAGLTALAAWGASELFAPRAAWLQVGAMLGTIMAANVFLVIIPAHWELIRAKEAEREPDPRWNRRGKQRSVHNNYLTLPVLATMLAGHWGFLYARPWSWAVLVALTAALVTIRHYFNLRHRGWNAWPILVGGAAALALLAWLLRPASEPAGVARGSASFARARAIVEQRCTPCHSQTPSRAGLSAPPQGVVFDSAERIRAQAQLIRRVAVDSHAMPPGNATRMTAAERAALGAWIASR